MKVPLCMLSSTSWAYCEKPSWCSLDFLLPILSGEGFLGNNFGEGDGLMLRPGRFARKPFKIGESPPAPAPAPAPVEKASRFGFGNEGSSLFMKPLSIELVTC